MKRKFLLTCAAVAALFAGTNEVSAQTLASVTDGTYYLYDSANKMWLSRGSNYRARAVEDYAGIGFTVATTDSKTTFTLPNYTSNTLFNANNNTVYCDNTTNNQWEIYSYGAGYVIKDANSTGNQGEYLTVNTEKQLTYTSDVASATVWQFQTYAQREETLAANKLAATIATLQAAGSSISSTATAAEVATELSTNWTNTDVTSSLTEQATSIKEVFNAAHDNPWAPNYNIASWSKTGLAKGLYKLSVNASYRMANNDNSYLCRTNNNEYQLVNFYANDVKYPVASLFSTGFDSNLSNNCVQQADSKWYPNGMSSCTTAFDAGNYLNELYINITDDEGTLNYGFNGMNLFDDNWLCYKNFKLTKYSNSVSDADADAILTTAGDLLNKNQSTDVKSALQSAKDAFSGSKTIANYNALSTAVTASQASVNAYTSAAAALDAQKALIDGTNVYDAEGFAKYKSTYETLKTKYDDLTLTNEEAVVNPTTATGWHASTDYNFLLTPWTIGGKTCNKFDAGMYINTWSTEGAFDGTNFTVPFFEYWTNDDKSLGATTINAEVAAEDGIYTVEAWVRVRAKNNVAAADATGITLNGVDATTGEQIGTSLFTIATIKAENVKVTNGKLNITFDVASDNNISWLSFKNVKYTKTGDVTADDYKLALTAAIAAAPVAPTANITTTGEAFKFNQKDIDANAEVVAKAQAVYDNASATIEEIKNATAAVKALTAVKANALTEAITRSIFINCTGNVAGYEFTGNNYMSAYVNATADGGYSMGYDPAGADGEFQNMTLTPVDGGYVTISFNNGIYMCTKATGYGDGSNVQLRVTEDATKALKITVVPSTTVEGVINLLNTEANVLIGAQDRGVYTVNSHNDFILRDVIETKNPKALASCKGYKTFYDANISYTVDANTTICVAAQPVNNTITVSAVEGETVIPAGTPVILKAADTDVAMTLTPTTASATASFEGNALQAATVAGVVENAYVLGYLDPALNPSVDNGFGFYKYEAALAAGQVYVQGYAGAKLSIVFSGDDATGVASVAEAKTAQKDGKYFQNGAVVIVKNGKKYNAAGAQMK